jgi:ketosteroid isomerase-like protein
MNIRTTLLGALLFGLCLPLVGVQAQESSDDQVAVWAVIERLWAMDNEGDSDWIDDMLTGDFVGWPYESPAPRTRASIDMWTEFSRRQAKPLQYELYPLSIVVHGDTASAHYLYTDAAGAADGRIITTNGRYTDVLVRDNRRWKFLSWHGGAFPPDTD